MSVETIEYYAPIISELEHLRKRNAPTSFEYDEPSGNKEARSYIYKVRTLKGQLERARKSAKADALAYGRKVDSQAKEIDQDLDALIEPHVVALRAIEDRERARVAAIDARLESLRAACADRDESGDLHGSTRLADTLESVRAIPLDDTWQEKLSEAGQLKDHAISKIERLLTAAKEREAEAAELARLREERARQAKLDDERRIAEAARVKAEADAERRRQAEQAAHQRALREAEEQREWERQSAERQARAQKEAHDRELREQKAAAERRELSLKLEAETRERERLAAESKAIREREARERDDQRRTKIHAGIQVALIKCGLTDSDSLTVVKAIASGSVPNVRIEY